MNRAVRVQRSDDDPRTLVYEGVGPKDSLHLFEPTYTCTRIWMGVVPPEDDQQGYAAVIGELNDFDPRQRERTCILLDEGMALNPEDFTESERRRFDIPDDNLRYPTKRRLAEAVVALKDLWWPWQILLPPGGGPPPDRGDRPEAPWTHYLRTTDGLTNYDKALGPGYFREWYPFYVNQKRVTKVVREVFHEDQAYNKALMEALFDVDKLRIAENCRVFLEQRLPCCERCVGLILAEMEYEDSTRMIRMSRFGDDYGDLHYDPERQERLRAHMDDAEDRRNWYGQAAQQ